MDATRLFTVQRDSTNLHEISSEETSVRKNNHPQSGPTSSAVYATEKTTIKVVCSGSH